MSTIREYLDTGTVIVETPQDVSYIVSCGGTAAIAVNITLKEQVIGTYVGDGVSLEFVDGGAGADSLTRNKGSWIDDGFGVGMTLAFANTVSNDGSTPVIVAVTADTLTFATGTIVAEAITDDTVTIDGNIAAGDFVLYETIAAGAKKFTYVEGSGTGLQFVKSGTGTVNIWVQS